MLDQISQYKEVCHYFLKTNKFVLCSIYARPMQHRSLSFQSKRQRYSGNRCSPTKRLSLKQPPPPAPKVATLLCTEIQSQDSKLVAKNYY